MNLLQFVTVASLLNTVNLEKNSHYFIIVLVLAGVVNLLHSSWFGFGNGVGNIETFLLLLSRAYSVKAFLLFTRPVRRLGVHKGLGGDTGRTADPN